MLAMADADFAVARKKIQPPLVTSALDQPQESDTRVHGTSELDPTRAVVAVGGTMGGPMQRQVHWQTRA